MSITPRLTDDERAKRAAKQAQARGARERAAPPKIAALASADVVAPAPSSHLVGVRPARSHAKERVRAQLVRKGDARALYLFEVEQRRRALKSGVPAALSADAAALRRARVLFDEEMARKTPGGRPKRLPPITTTRNED